MFNQHPSEVAIDLSSSYRNLTRESDKEYGGEHGSSTMWQILSEKIPNPSDYEPRRHFPIWEDKIFIISCAFAVLFNPLFIYLPVIYPEQLCFKWDVSLMWIYVGLQSAIDLFYAMYIFVFIWRIRGKRNAKVTVKTRMLEWLSIIHRIYLFLPISQAGVLLGYFGTKQVTFLFKVVRVCLYPIQYTLRAYCTFGLNKQRPNVESGIGKWLQAILDFLPFIIASHLFGALWYGFAVDREIHCWRKASFLMQCHISDFHCDHKDVTAGVLRTCNMTHIKASCDPTDKKNSEFGIFRNALQSNLTRSAFFPRKFLQSFWWGLRNLSSFGSNLETSSNMLEIHFSILTSISGLVLFLIYLNARVEESQKRSDRIKLRLKMQTMNPDIDMWLTKYYLSGHNKKLLKKVIMKNVLQKLEENKDVEVQNLFSLLPIVNKRQIMSLSRLACLQKVPMFKYMKIRVLKAIVKHLELVTYTKNCYIIREGEPLWNVIFITQGTALSYKTSSNANIGGSISDSSIIKCLKKDDFFGDELLDWAFAFASISDLPISPKTVVSQTRVEAFAINASNLRRVVSKFRLHFILNLPDLKHSPLEHMAATSLQTAWRERENPSRGWNKLKELLNYSSESD